MFEKLTLKSIDARAVLVPLRRPVVSKVGLFKTSFWTGCVLAALVGLWGRFSELRDGATKRCVVCRHFDSGMCARSFGRMGGPTSIFFVSIAT